MDQAIINELVGLRSMARAAADAFSEAVKEQAEAHEVARSALRKFICALENDSLEKLDTEACDISALVMTNK